MTTQPSSREEMPYRTASDKTAPTAANRLGLDYAAEAARFPRLPFPIIDVHTHINGPDAALLYRDAARAYGIVETWTMTKLEEVGAIRKIVGPRTRFIAVPDYWSGDDLRTQMTTGFIERISAYHAAGAEIIKFWVAPRSTDYAIEMGEPDLLKLDAPHRRDAMQAARDLNMIFMTHVADPDTWFKTRYTDAEVYGTKREQYEPLEILLEEFDQPWIAAHMGGWPEDLAFLTGLLERHDNLYLDSSATKWMVRELSRHSRKDLLAFLTQFPGRILFGSDIVTADEHLGTDETDAHEMYSKASTKRDAYDLYAGRYWALRTLFETSYEGESPIADPDLALVDPVKFNPMDAPLLRGHELPAPVLRELYHDGAARLLAPPDSLQPLP